MKTLKFFIYFNLSFGTFILSQAQESNTISNSHSTSDTIFATSAKALTFVEAPNISIICKGEDFNTSLVSHNNTTISDWSFRKQGENIELLAGLGSSIDIPAANLGIIGTENEAINYEIVLTLLGDPSPLTFPIATYHAQSTAIIIGANRSICRSDVLGVGDSIPINIKLRGSAPWTYRIIKNDSQGLSPSLIAGSFNADTIFNALPLSGINMGGLARRSYYQLDSSGVFVDAHGCAGKILRENPGKLDNVWIAPVYEGRMVYATSAAPDSIFCSGEIVASRQFKFENVMQTGSNIGAYQVSWKRMSTARLGMSSSKEGLTQISQFTSSNNRKGDSIIIAVIGRYKTANNDYCYGTDTMKAHIYVNPVPSLNIAATQLYISACNGISTPTIVLKTGVRTSNGIDSMHYLWTANAAHRGLQKEGSFTSTKTPLSHNFSFKAINGNTFSIYDTIHFKAYYSSFGLQCSKKTVDGKVDSTRLIIKVRPSLKISSDLQDGNFCDIEEKFIGIIVVGESPKFQWYRARGINDKLTKIAGASESTYKIVDSGYYQVWVSGDCGTTIKSNKAAIGIGAGTTILQMPVDTVVCSGSTVNLKAASNSENLQWYKDGIALGGKTNSTLSLSKVSSEKDFGYYSLSAKGFCPNDSIMSPPFRLWVAESPSMSFIDLETRVYRGQQYFVKTGQKQADGKKQTPGYADATYYKWSYIDADSSEFFKDEGPNLYTTLLRYTGTSPVGGMGKLSVSISHPCGSARQKTLSANITVVNDISSIEAADAEMFHIYPNPILDIFNVSSPKIILAIVVSDLNGRMIYTNNEVEHTRMQINTTSWLNGIYLVSVQTKEGKEVKKIIKR